MSVGDWMVRLEETFLKDRTQCIDGVLNSELAFGRHVHATVPGHVVLLDSFHMFFCRTLESALTSQVPHSNAHPYYGPILVEYLTAFRGFRAAEIVFRNGYPLAGFTLLRDLKDRALFLAAIAADRTTYRALHGLDGLAAAQLQNKEPLDVVRQFRTREERRVLKLMIRSASGLSEATLHELARWEALFHTEVHGSRLTGVDGFGPWLNREKPFSMGPELEERGGSMYTNRASEIAWMWHRLLPYLQISDSGFGREWADEWLVLDDSLSFMVEGLRTMGKPVGDALLELLQVKFTLRPASRYVEAVGPERHVDAEGTAE